MALAEHNQHITTIQVEGEAHWHRLRAAHVGGSEVAALFDESPHMTRFELWHHKVGNIERKDLSGVERVFWGQTLEPAIAKGVAEVTGWQIRNVHRYFSMESVGLGGSLDYEIVAHERGPGVLEIKTVDRLQYMNWDEGEPPIHYLLQMQSYLALTGRQWGAFGILIGGNELKIIEYERREKTIDLIISETSDFWQSVRERREPKPNFELDAGTVSKLYGTGTDKALDLRGNNHLASLCAAYSDAGERARVASKEKDAAKAEILTLIGDAGKVLCDGFSISAKTVAEKEMSYMRPAYRNFRVTAKKEKANA